MKIDKKVLLKTIIFSVAGAGLGYAYYYYIGCVSGTCPISSDPLISTLYGSALGFLFAFPSKKKSENNK